LFCTKNTSLTPPLTHECMHVTKRTLTGPFGAIWYALRVELLARMSLVQMLCKHISSFKATEVVRLRHEWMNP